MFELYVELSKRLFSRNSNQNSSIFRPLFVGPIFLIATLTIGLLKVYLAPSIEWYWGLCFSLSLGLGFFISYLSFQQGTAHLRLIEEVVQEKEEKLIKLQGLIEEAQAFAKENERVAHEMIEDALNKVDAFQRKAEMYENLANEKTYDWEALEKEIEALKEERSKLEWEHRKELERAKQSAEPSEYSQTLNKEYEILLKQRSELEKKIETQDKQIATLREKEQQFHPYLEVRKQFEEKAEILTDTRQELFELQGRYLALQKKHELIMHENNAELSMLINHFQALEDKHKHLEDERAHLEELVTILSVKKPAIRKRKATTKKTNVKEVELADLFS